ncbi:MAG: carboxypeptidase regulatory-like domain-containing protein, partial [Candidatus Cloacimonadaceae bacterium]|nr:carboxypeptidase regulatory-like domain-containing protein [Candidatus Cloacimonadaceae bacterium]
TVYPNHPIDTTFRASKYQCIYQAQNFGTPMSINGLSLFSFFAEAAPQIPVKLWLANTTQSDLSQGFIPVQEFTLVFDGIVDFAPGSNTVLFGFSELPQSFQYTGGNLALMALRGYSEAEHSPQNRFASFNIGWAQARSLSSNLDNVLPGSQGGVIVDTAPKVAFLGSVSPIGHLRGTLLDLNNHPIPDITIHLSGRPDVVTNQFGAFEFMYYPAGDYTVSCWVLGYADYSHQFSLPAGQITYHNISPVPLFSVGTVAGMVRNTQGIALSGVLLQVEDFYTHSDASGNYVLNLPIGTHTIVVTAPEYHSQNVNNVVVQENQTTALDITLIHESDNDDQVSAILETSLSGNFPNPFNPSTTIEFNLVKAAFTRLEIYNLKGQLVKTLAREELRAGKHEVVWNGIDNTGRKVSSGIYLLRLSHDGKSYSRKMMMLK